MIAGSARPTCWWNMIWMTVGAIAGFPDRSAWMGEFGLLLGGGRARQWFAHLAERRDPVQPTDSDWLNESARREAVSREDWRRSVRDMTQATLGAALVLAVATLVAGCAGAAGRITYDKPGVTQADRKQDEGACLREAIATDGSGRMFAPYLVDRELYGRCMEARGYSAKTQ